MTDPAPAQPGRESATVENEDGTERADTYTIPSPRQGAAANPSHQVAAKLTVGPDGTLWVTVHGADVQQLAHRINAVCDGLNPGAARP